MIGSRALRQASARGLMPVHGLVAAHGLAAMAAFLASSPRAGFVALVVSILALLRYAAMAGFARYLGRGPAALVYILGAAWAAAFLALAFALAAVARFARPCLPWAAAAALAGPAWLSLETLACGLRGSFGAFREGKAV